VDITPLGGDGGPGSGSGGTGGDFIPTTDSGSGVGTLLNQDQCGKRTTGVIRDFRLRNPPDFEAVGQAEVPGKHEGDDKGMVQAQLGADRKPVYAGPAGGTLTTTGPENFHMWFNDVDGINRRALYAIQFSEQQIQNPSDPSKTVTQYSYNDTNFFPLDGNDAWGYGNEGLTHNFSFTVEFHTQFLFNGWEVFDFSGDDDVWVFLNNRLAVDLGGIHSMEPARLDFVAHPELATQFGLVPGNSYNFDFFYCERHTTASDFMLTTTLAFQDCMVF
jgi:fibro-slime domain-containing protein